MTHQELFDLFEANADSERAAGMSAYMRGQFPFLGLSTPQRAELSRAFLTEARRAAGVDWGFVDRCWGRDEREFQYLAVAYLRVVQRRLSPADVPHLRRLAVTKSWWDTIDGLDRIVGTVALAFPEVNEVLLAWSVDEDFWLRRIAIDHQRHRKDKTDTGLLERVIVNNLGVKEFFVTKAIGWSLRDYSKTDPAWVRAFIERHRDQMAPLSIREASKYL
ncbi:MAG: DNA alkylation repair protein [Propionibacteriaceae bacterium]|jgi:3-methyladenine DNA glycosylase AlkD|nr:DNA alkylation repair protein [Propionibacteriaceae bacterium]